MKQIAVFASGNGTNFEALVNNAVSYKVVLLVSDQKNAYCLKRAKELNVPFYVFSPYDYESKTHYENELLNELIKYKIDFIALAGYMRIIGNTLLDAYENRIVNIHPSLLPAFKGKDAIGQALDYGVKITGVTVHYIDQGMDTGTIIAQEAFSIKDKMTKVQIEQEIHDIEHQLYPKVLNQLFTA